MKTKTAPKKQKEASSSSVYFMTGMIGAGFCMMLFFSLFAYKIELKHKAALETKVVSERKRVAELEKLLRIKEKELQTLKN